MLIKCLYPLDAKVLYICHNITNINMRRFNNTTIASKNVRYKKIKEIKEQHGIFCELCGSKMYHDEYGVFRCPNCDVGISAVSSDSQVY